MVDLDFQRTICERDKLAVWFAFWGERRFRPTYRRICAERDRSYDDMVRAHVREALRAGRLPGRRARARRRRPVRAHRRPLARPAGAAGLHEPRTGATHHDVVPGGCVPAPFQQPAPRRRGAECHGSPRPIRAPTGATVPAIRDRRADSLGSRGGTPRGKLPPEVEDGTRSSRSSSASARWTCRRRMAAVEPRIVDQVAVWEQLGRVTNALCWCFSEPSAGCSRPAPPDQLERFILPLMTRRAQGMLRDHRERLRIGRRHRHGRRAARGRLPDHRRKMVRHERELRRLLHPAGEARGRAACGRARTVLHRQGRAGHRAPALAAVQPHVLRRPSPDLPLPRRRRAGGPAHRPRR